MIKFLKELKFHYDQRQSIRFLLFTYPKTIGALFIGATLITGFTIDHEFNNLGLYNDAISFGIHSNKTGRVTNKVVVYDSENKN